MNVTEPNVLIPKWVMSSYDTAYDAASAFCKGAANASENNIAGRVGIVDFM